ncbi:PREDICTED: melanoma inhibitory activity protein 3 [Nanorana parkeri]|uniref:melanoma inhibitory activity protein 3 n=1 Tax=Nanorana parkeri TaxID=125878 RepID=UPI0008545383|nr:PREDICTED: melanoma inhibitory activity protein 3 [Nanorana parkeri]
MAAAGPHIYLLLLIWQLVPGGGSAAQERTFSDTKRCADPECSKLMCRGKAIADFTGPDCRFVNLKKDDLVYVYYKLTGRSSELWAGSVNSGFGYFPKDLIDIQQGYTTDELEFPTDYTDFVCFDDGSDTFDSYDVNELLSKAKIKLYKQTSQDTSLPLATETLPVEQSASESEVKSEEPSSKYGEPPGESPQSESEEPTKEAPPSEAEESREKPLPSETKEPPEKASSLDSRKPLEELSNDAGDQADSEFSIPQDKPSASDSGPTPEELHLSSSETLPAHSQSEVDSPLGVSGPGTEPREVSTSESDKHAEEDPSSDSEKTERQPLFPESDKPSVEVPASASQEQVTPSERPEKESESDHREDELKKSKDSLFATNDAHTTTVNSKPKDSQEESVVHSATEENAKSNSQVPDSEKANNVSISQGDFKENKNIESFTQIDKDRIVNLKTEAGLTGDAVVTEDEETRYVTIGGEDQNEDFKPYEPQEEEGVGEPEETPLLSHEEFDMKSLDQTAFENDSASNTASEAKTSPSKEEVKVAVDMGHATPIKQDKSILTSLGDTFFAIVSGGEHTQDVTDPDGTDSEEQEDDDEPSEELEDDETLYLLGMEKSNMHENEHLEPPFDDDTLALKEEELQEGLLAVDGEKSLESEQKINITANNLTENTVNMSSADGTHLPTSSDDSKSVHIDPDLQEQPEIKSVKETSELKTEAVDSEISEKTVEKSQTPPNDVPLEGSKVKETEIKISGENQVNVEHRDKPVPEDLQKNKDIKLEDVREGLLEQEALKQEDSANEELPKLSEESKLENPNIDQDQTKEIKLDKGPPLTSEIPEDVKSTSDSVTAGHPGLVENSKIQSSDPLVEETASPKAGGNEEKENLEDRKPVDEQPFKILPIVEDVLAQESSKENIEDRKPVDEQPLKILPIVEDVLAQESSEEKENIEDRKPVDEQPLKILPIVENVLAQESSTVDTSLETSNNNQDTEHEQLESRDHKQKQESKDIDSLDSFKGASTESTVSNQSLEVKTASDIESPPVFVDKEEREEQNVDGFLEDENAASARQARETLAKTEQETKIDPEVSAESEPNQGLKKSDLERKDTNTEETEDLLPLKKDATQNKEEESGKENNKEPIVVTEDLNEETNNISDPKIEIQAEVIKIETLEVEHKAETSTEDGKENISPDHQTDDKIADIEESEPLDEELAVDSTLPNNDPLEEASYIENIKALSIMREFLHEERIAEFTKFLGPDNIMRLEAMFQDMDSELRLARKDNLRLDHNDEALDQILEASELNILEFVESVLDSRDANPEEMAIGKEMFDDEATLLEDVQEISYRLRHKHSALSDSSLLASGEIKDKEDEEKSFSDDVNPEEDKLEPDPITKEEESTVTPPPEKEIVDQPSDTEERTFEEEKKKKEAEVVLPTPESLDHTPHELDEAVSQNKENVGIGAALGDDGEERQDLEPWYTLILQIFSSIGSALLAAKKSLVPVAGLECKCRAAERAQRRKLPVEMDEMEQEDPISSSSSFGVGADPAVLGTLPTLYSLLISRLLQLMSALPEDLRPGPDFYGVQWEAIIITVFVGLISVLIFFWRTCLSVKSRVYQVNEKQLAEKIAALVKEKSEALEKISELENKIKEAKECESTTQEKNTQIQEEAASLKVTVKELKNSNKQFDGKMRNLLQELDSQKSQNKRKQEMIYEGQKSIEQLKQQYEEHSAELSELQIALNEVKMKEQKVRSNLRSVQEENTCLKERKEQLLQEAEGWSERQRELEEQIQLQQKAHKDMEEALAYKENEIEVLTNCIMQLKQLEEDSVAGEDGSWQPAGDGEHENGELPDKRKEKMKLQIKQMMDVSRVKTTLSIIEEEKDLYQRKLTDEISARHELEEEIKQLQHDSSSIHSDKTRLDNECKTLRQKVEILTELYQQKEMALQKKLTQEEYERQEKEQKLSVADEKAILAIEDVKIYKQRIQEMEEELQKTERSFKNQIASHEKKAHENWLVARTAERTLAEEKRECANLRQKLIEVNQKVATLQRPAIVKPTPGRPEHQPPPRRGAQSRDGSFGPSPVSGGAPSPPIMMDASVRSASANLNRSEDLKGNIGGMDAPSGSRRPPHDMSGRISAPVDLGHSSAMLNSGPRTSSPSVDGLPNPSIESEAPVMPDSSQHLEESPAVMPVAKGPPSFPGTPVMNSPAGAPMMSQPPGRLMGPTPPRGHFGARSLPPAQMHGPSPVPRDYPPRPLLPPGGMPPPDPRGLIRGPLHPREYPPGPVPLHGPRDYPIPPPGARDFPPGLPPPGPRDFPPGPPFPGSRDFPPGPPPPGARDFLPGPRDFPPGLPPPGAQEFPPGRRDFPPSARDIPPGLPPPGARDFLPILPHLGSREFVPGLPPPGARFLHGPPPGSREFLPGPPPHGARDFAPGPSHTGVRDFVPGPHPGVPAWPSLPDQRPVPPGHNPPSQTDNEQSHAHHKPSN